MKKSRFQPNKKQHFHLHSSSLPLRKCCSLWDPSGLPNVYWPSYLQVAIPALRFQHSANVLSSSWSSATTSTTSTTIIGFNRPTKCHKVNHTSTAAPQIASAFVTRFVIEWSHAPWSHCTWATLGLFGKTRDKPSKVRRKCTKKRLHFLAQPNNFVT